MEHPTAEKVLLVPTPAGLSGEFQADKRAQHLSARPFALLRECLEDAASSTVASLLEAYLRTEFAKRLDSDQFNWKLIHGTGIWLLDGLDKVLERGLTRLRRLRQIFGKFVEETGQGRRKHLDKRAVLNETCLEPGCSHVQ